MIESINSEIKPKEAQFIHQGLIKIIVEYQMKTKGVVWKDFLTQHQFEEQIIEEKFKPVHETKSIMN